MERLLINTPQNVNIEYRLASVGMRLLGIIIDYAVMIVYAYLAIYFLSKMLHGVSDKYFIWGVYSFFLLPVLLYHFWMETFFRGQTIGKMLLKTKVVRMDGGRASVYEYFVRWSMNIVDIWIIQGVVGLLSIILTKKSQRVGDMAANTAVISLKPRLQLTQTIYENLVSEYQPVFAESQINKLSDKDINIIKENFQEAVKKGNTIVLNKLAEKIMEVTEIKPDNMSYSQFVDTVLKDHFHYNKES